MAFPRNNSRHTDSSFVQIAFVSAVDAVAIEKIGISPTFAMWAVITRKNDQCIFVNTFGFESFNNLPHIHINSLYHSRVSSTGMFL
ncbi:hypothetical protein SDC9_197480 [bioreactor metagenome]|uniref:Uncharacterized protein n=1 Tax=bioreactor metagenome TaxID=1076179 RepID=A0A645IFX3_9ZZZZ